MVAVCHQLPRHQQQHAEKQGQGGEQDHAERARDQRNRLRRTAEETRATAAGDTVQSKHEEHPDPETRQRRTGHQTPPGAVLGREQRKRLPGGEQVDRRQVAEQHREQRPRQASRQGATEQQEAGIEDFAGGRGTVVGEEFHAFECTKPCAMTNLRDAGIIPTR